MGLAAVTLLAFLITALASLAGWWLSVAALAVGLLAALVFGLTEIPFLVKVWRRDRGVTLPAVGLLWVRAFTLGTGFALGLIHFRGRFAGSRPPIAGWQRAVKRLMDVVLGAMTLAVMALPMVGIALLVKLDSPGPIFFRQTRMGQDGRPFRIFKFRTMVDHAEEMLPQLVDLEALSQPAFKLQSDPRVTRAGRFLRRWSLDEVPQLFNVLAGEMSLVGPRPEQIEVVTRYTDDQRRRLAVKPGMTGPMQVSGRGNLPFEERLALELTYIGRYSLRRDLSILLWTIPAVVRGDGAY
jgi:lipopolysaccharide/colanic/teichoic acid biosynthesis glycosyltransferase